MESEPTTRCDADAKHFCPHRGVLPEESASPATLAGRASGDVRVRLRAAALIASGIWALYSLLEALRGSFDAILGVTAAGLGLASAVLYALSRRDVRERTLTGAGSLYLLAVSVAVAAVEMHLGATHTGLAGGVSWNAVWVAFFPLMVPCAPRATLVKALIAASATPVVLALFVGLGGHGMPAALDLAALVVPVYVAAFLAWVGARLLSKLGRELSAARSVGRYELSRRLGAGGMGEVWEATHRLLARPVALKLVRQDADSTLRARFEREARVTASLRSPHTVQLYDYGLTDAGEMFYVMELLDGMDLEQLVRAHGPMPPARVVHVLRQALASLEEAHARGLVHRDIKPANLHLGRQGLGHDHLKVLDFGLVKPSPDASALGPTLTADGRISGTPAYLALESVTGDGSVDGRADVYALGCVAYFLLTGARVFEADDVIRAAVAHVTETPIPPSARGAELSPELEAVILTCLEKDPVRRPDAWSLREMLDACDVDPWTDADARNWWADASSERDPRPADGAKAGAIAPTLVAGHA
ncbi:MAG TPA: serine/threonine-protein kinase [Sandaracinaceae bacterium LLY-WYZ-13_1]|nr:serine/threonine-protein kinase [Sandaracinaceae bacterium LLY-WYZ-13_1]